MQKEMIDLWRVGSSKAKHDKGYHHKHMADYNEDALKLREGSDYRGHKIVFWWICMYISKS